MEREYQIFRREKGSENKWLSTTKSCNWEYISRVFRMNTVGKNLNKFEWKIVTVN